MNNYFLENDIHVFYVTATSFPAGIVTAHQKLHALLPTTEGRKFFGISRPDHTGTIIYKAAVEELHEGEAEKYSCEKFIISKGNYASEMISNYMEKPDRIMDVFQKLTRQPDLDMNGACIEVYLSEEELRCMVRLNK